MRYPDYHEDLTPDSPHNSPPTNMKSFLALLSIATLSSSHAFHASAPLPIAASSRVGSRSTCVSPQSQDGDASTIDTSNAQSPLSNVATVFASTVAVGVMLLSTVGSTAWAVSGGGLDYAGIDISGQDFSNASYKGKDFTQVRILCRAYVAVWYFKYCINGTYIANSFSRAQVLAKATNFAKSNLQGCRFYKAYLVRGPLWLFALVCSR